MESLEKAKHYAFLLLKFRLRSEHELALRLARKKFTPEVIAGTLAFLKARGLLNDQEFAKTWISARVKKSFGFKRIREELALKGINRQITESQIQEAKEDYPESKLISAILQERLPRLKNQATPIKRRRLYSYLLRRGFSADAASEAVNDIK